MNVPKYDKTPSDVSTGRATPTSAAGVSATARSRLNALLPKAVPSRTLGWARSPSGECRSKSRAVSCRERTTEMLLRRILFGAISLFVLLALGGFAWTWRPAIAPIAANDRLSVDEQTYRRGAELAAIGNCNDCHVGDSRQGLCGRATHTHAFRNNFCEQHHARHRDGNRGLVRGDVPARHARGRRSRRPTALPGLSV